MNQNAVVTAGTRGIGFEVASELSRLGFAVTIVGRDREHGERAQDRIDGARFVQADLSALAEVRALGARLAEEGPLRLLVNNVGGMWSERWETVDGIEASFAQNHLSPAVLTEALLGALRAGAPGRIVDVTSSSIGVALMAGTQRDPHRPESNEPSSAHRAPPASEARTLSYHEVEQPGEYYGMAVSGRAKLAHLAYNRDLAERLRGTGIGVFAADPGPAATPNAALMTPEVLPPPLRPHWEQIQLNLRRPAAEAARPVVFAATDPSLERETGLVIDAECAPSESLTAALTPDILTEVRELTDRVLMSV